ncbi:MAG: hypothetical protein IKM45_05455 [Opitutales bacterium]|nr:hypothetical protein [Opitutales bacterium]
MKKKFLQFLALVALISVPATGAFAQAAPAGNSVSDVIKATDTKKKKRVVIKFGFEKPVRQTWEINYPEKLLPPGAKKPKARLTFANLKDSPRGVMVVKENVDLQTGMRFTDEVPLKNVVGIIWENETQLKDARNDLVQGNPAAALATAERFLAFFKDLKAVPGSLWLEAAVIKLDALDLQENDAIMDSFIRELQDTPGWEKIEGLPERIKLVRLRQQLRKGDFQRVLRDAGEMMKATDDQATLAQLTMLKGQAEFNLGKYEDALYTFLRIPVFYGNQTEYVPASKLGVARCFLKLDSPDRKAQNLPALAESYVMEVVTEYSMTPEAKEALALLPKDKQAALASRNSLEEDQKRAMISASISSEGSDATSAGVSDGSEDLIVEDEEIEIDDSETE